VHLTVRQLRVFCEVARQGSVLGASQVLHLTPPAVSQLLKAVEQQAGHTLFDRGGRRMSLTTAGEYFLHYARRVLATLKDAEDTMARLARLETGRVTVCMAAAASYFLPQLLAAFRAEHPGIDVRLRLGRRADLAAMLHAGEADVGVMGRPPADLPCRVEPFAMHPHGLVCSRDHPFARAEEVPVAALAEQPFIVREPTSGTRDLLQQFLDQHGIQPTFVMEMPSDEAIKHAVIAGMGVSVLSLHTIALEWNSGLLAAPAVPGLPLVRRWNVVHVAGKALSPAAEAFRYFILERGEAHLASLFARETA
jgi:LysR family transcriptional regulator, low CO2-responsive transcriptional regulator